MFTIFCQNGILIFCFLHIDHNIKLYPWTIAEGLSKKMKNYECPGQGPLCIYCDLVLVIIMLISHFLAFVRINN